MIFSFASYSDYFYSLIKEVLDNTESGKRLNFTPLLKKLSLEGDTNAYMAIVCRGKRFLYTREDVYKDEKGHFYKK